MKTSLINQILFVGQGVGLTLQLLICSLICGLILGALLSLLRYKKIGTPLIRLYISVLRGTPLILQLSIVYFSIPSLMGLKISVFFAGVLAFGLNSAAYIAEIFRAGIQSIPKGQFEAAQVLEIPSALMWKDILFPQVLKNIFPGLVNEIITLLKESALIGTIGGMDLMRKSQILGSQNFDYFQPLCIAAAYYYILVLAIEFIGHQIEKGAKA